MYGKQRTRMTRLLRDAYPATTSLLIETGLDWTNGDKLALPATNLNPWDSETVVVEDYDPNSGLLEVVEPLTGYHFGAADSTEEQYDVDMRGEVLLLSSNVNVTATDEDDHGCHIWVTDWFERDFT